MRRTISAVIYTGDGLPGTTAAVIDIAFGDHATAAARQRSDRSARVHNPFVLGIGGFDGEPTKRPPRLWTCSRPRVESYGTTAPRRRRGDCLKAGDLEANDGSRGVMVPAAVVSMGTCAGAGRRP
jgi:hypothetical protein